MLRMSGAIVTLPYLSLILLAGLACAKPQAPNAGELALGSTAPPFELRGVDGKMHSLPSPEEAKAVVVVFTCLSCPFAQAYEDRIIAIARDYTEPGVRVVAIMSNDPAIVPADSFDKMKARSAEKEYPFPFLIDETQSVARAYGAAVTPHVFVFGPDRKLAYRGRIDDSADPAKTASPDLRNALDAVLAEREVTVASTKAFGCTIKWKKEKPS